MTALRVGFCVCLTIFVTHALPQRGPKPLMGEQQKNGPGRPDGPEGAGGPPTRTHPLAGPKFRPNHVVNGVRVKSMQAPIKNPGPPPKYGKAPEDNLDLNKVDGDMVMTDKMKQVFGKGGGASNRNMLRQNMTEYMWPNAQVCYGFDSTVDDATKAVVAAAIVDFENYTCVRFYQYVDSTTTPDCVIVSKASSGCFSSVAKVGGNQTLNLGDGCESKGIALHEFMHAMGFDHEQNRADRDTYVTINYDNIVDGYSKNFDKTDTQYFSTYDTPYDYGSVLHYGSTYFAKSSGLDTITPVDSTATIGQRTGMSTLDIEKLNLLYSCNADGSSGDGDVTTTQTVTTVAPAITTTAAQVITTTQASGGSPSPTGTRTMPPPTKSSPPPTKSSTPPPTMYPTPPPYQPFKAVGGDQEQPPPPPPGGEDPYSGGMQQPPPPPPGK